MARRHDAQTTKIPQAMVPATVVPQARCPRCTFFFLGQPGGLCPSCGGISVTDVPAPPEQAPDAPASQDARWRRDMGTRLETLEEQARQLFEHVRVLRQAIERGPAP